MRHLPHVANENVLVGFSTSDDAGVYRLRDDLALVQTVDFFTPIVDDPFDFGRIAAANSFSDIYAMGAKPISALNIAAFPSDTLELQILTRILQGGASIAKEAGVAILGGHTIKDAEPKYGMAVTGTVDPHFIVTNANARPGDTLLLTKHLGTGILTTAFKRGALAASGLAPAIASMAALNDHASTAMCAHHANAATDVTGFGFLGHANEIARASHVRLRLRADLVPLLDGVLELIEAGMIPGGTHDNAATHAAFTTFAADVSPARRIALSDAQTSGGLLISVPSAHADALRETLRSKGVLDAVVGQVESGDGIIVE